MIRKYSIKRLVKLEDSIGFLSGVQNSSDLIVMDETGNYSKTFTQQIKELAQLNSRRKQIIENFKKSC